MMYDDEPVSSFPVFFLWNPGAEFLEYCSLLEGIQPGCPDFERTSANRSLFLLLKPLNPQISHCGQFFFFPKKRHTPGDFPKMQL